MLIYYNMYNTITNPITGRKVFVNGKLGEKILRGYIGQSSYKCVFSPPIKCQGSERRYVDGIDSSGNYVSAIMALDMK